MGFSHLVRDKLYNILYMYSTPQYFIKELYRITWKFTKLPFCELVKSLYLLVHAYFHYETQWSLINFQDLFFLASKKRLTSKNVAKNCLSIAPRLPADTFGFIWPMQRPPPPSQPQTGWEGYSETNLKLVSRIFFSVIIILRNRIKIIQVVYEPLLFVKDTVICETDIIEVSRKP